MHCYIWIQFYHHWNAPFGPLDLVHELFNAIIITTSLYAFAHILILSASLALVLIRIFFIKLEQIHVEISSCQNGTFRWGCIPRFKLHMVELFRHLHWANETYCKQFFIFLLVNLPSNLFYVILLFQGLLSEVQWIAMAALAAQQMIAFFVIHFVTAYFSQRLIRPNRILFRLYCQNLFRIGNFVGRLQHSLTIERYHCVKRYGFTYSKYGLISISAFFKVK